MKWLQLVFEYLPAALQVIAAVEHVLAGQPGAAKKAVVMAALAPPVPVETDVSRLVDSLVASLNAAKVFVPSAAVVK